MASARGRLAALFRKPFGWLHLAWAVLIVAVCVVLLTTEGGHPPAMILVPPALLVGLLGHLLGLAIAWLLGRGRARLARAGATPRWPLELTAIAVAVVTGLLGVAAYVLRAARIRSALG